MLTSNKKRIWVGLASFASFAILAFPVMGATAATNNANTNVTATLGSVISISTTNPAAINVTPTSGGSQSSANGTVTVSTNNITGYNLTVSDASPAMVSGANTIPASTGTAVTPVVLANNTWGYRIDNSNGFGAASSSTPLNNAPTSTLTYAGVTSTPVQVKTTAVPVASDVTTVSYSVKANSSQASGSYTGEVTYTATTN